MQIPQPNVLLGSAGEEAGRWGFSPKPAGLLPRTEARQLASLSPLEPNQIGPKWMRSEKGTRAHHLGDLLLPLRLLVVRHGYFLPCTHRRRESESGFGVWGAREISVASGKWRRRRWGSGPRVMRRWEGPELGEPLPIFVAIQRLRCSSFRRSLVVFVHSFFFFFSF